MVATDTSKSVVSLSGYKRDLHNAEVALLTPSTNDYEYMLVDGALSRMARRLVTVTYNILPMDFMAAHRDLMHTLQDYGVWCLLERRMIPAYVVGTLLQVKNHVPGLRVFMVRGSPFHLTEFLN